MFLHLDAGLLQLYSPAQSSYNRIQVPASKRLKKKISSLQYNKSVTEYSYYITHFEQLYFNSITSNAYISLTYKVLTANGFEEDLALYLSNLQFPLPRDDLYQV
jgi:hypothetical protein